MHREQCMREILKMIIQMATVKSPIHLEIGMRANGLRELRKGKALLSFPMETDTMVILIWMLSMALVFTIF